MSQTPLLLARGVEKRYGDVPVLERLDFQVDAGEFVTLVGASGCGKTTLLKMLLGTEQPSRGEFLLEGAPLPDEPGVDRGVVFQRYSVFPHLTALDNMVLAEEFALAPLTARLFGAARRQARERAAANLAEVGLAQAMTRYPYQLSGGMQQRLALAQALTMRPRLLLLDEPFGALDPGIRLEMHALISRLWRERSLTIFMVTHDLREAFTLGTRVWVFDHLRHDPQAPEAFGATITYDLPIAARTKATPDIPPALIKESHA
ncbi:ABC transporter ATP-binding protein [Halotalea alkalilenta]|uniref:Lauroyl acyltransferase n=1 Tax=Halotalea alkalilenta TaxID=376489 RepID=A0A172YHT7_9GAMM|nr:ATP-binding cassette domain-containing protein [Halotalea alkalilenta]ANF58706.1 lauroyl acyltransferase [Halotalea alkalilenta]